MRPSANLMEKLNLSFPPQLADTLRVYLAATGRGRKGDISAYFASLARSDIEAWLLQRAASTGHEKELTRPADAPAPAEAERAPDAKPRIAYSDDEMASLVQAALQWSEL